MYLEPIDLHLLLATLSQQNWILCTHRAEVFVCDPEVRKHLPFVVPQPHLRIAEDQEVVIVGDRSFSFDQCEHLLVVQSHQEAALVG